jgi:peptide/nickel transport system substrate-binding protein
MRPGFIPIALVLAASLTLTACSGSNGQPKDGAPATQPAGPKKGGVLKVALNASPPTLDYQSTTTGLTKKVAWHIYEGLFTLDKDYKVIPMLAESLPEISPDGTTFTIKLRQNVPFHNGQVMKADDVIASLNRWFQIAPSGRDIMNDLESLTKKDDATIVLKLKRPYGVLLEALANPDQSAIIMPAAIATAAGKDPVKEFIGTGPYKFAEWKPDQYIKLVRFDAYAARSEEASGLGGKKVAYLDEIQFLPVKDETVRGDGVATGEYDVADIVPADSYDRLKENKDLQLVVEKPFRWVGGVFNTTKAPFNNVKARQAVLAAVNPSEVMTAAIGAQPFWRLDAGLSFLETAYHSDAAKELYNQNNPEKAKQLLKESGYNGEPVVLLTTKDYPYMYKSALVTKANLEAVGFKVDLQVYDWATVTARRGDKSKWDMFFTGFLFSVEPTAIPFIPATGSWPGWYKSDAMQKLIQEFQSKVDFAGRKSVADKIQQLFYEEVPVVKYGDSFELVVLNKNVQGYRNMIDITFWNVWLDGK